MYKLFKRCSVVSILGSFLFILPMKKVLAADFDHSHEEFTQILKKYVKRSLVDYSKLKSDPDELNDYLNKLASVKKDEFNGWSEQQQLAYLTNLYNAQTLHLIIQKYPLKSIKDIGNRIFGPWSQKVVRLFGKVITLNKLEHGILRKKYKEPRLHFALVCAALGCPPLREEAYVAGRLNEQLEDQGKVFFSNKQKNNVDVSNRVLNISPIFDWFDGDFEDQSGSVQAFIRPYLDLNNPNLPDTLKFKLEYTFYDWSLNDASSQSSK